MKCQYSGSCVNVGIHSCSKCGKLFCGKHADVNASTYGIHVSCTDCRLAAQNQLSAPMGAGCWTMLTAPLIIIAGVYWALASGLNAGGGWVITLGIVVGVVGLAIMLAEDS